MSEKQKQKISIKELRIRQADCNRLSIVLFVISLIFISKPIFALITAFVGIIFVLYGQYYDALITEYKEEVKQIKAEKENNKKKNS